MYPVGTDLLSVMITVFFAFFLLNMLTVQFPQHPSVKMAQYRFHSGGFHSTTWSVRTGNLQLSYNAHNDRWTTLPQTYALSPSVKSSHALKTTSAVKVRAGVRPFLWNIPAAYRNRGVVPFSSMCWVSCDDFKGFCVCQKNCGLCLIQSGLFIIIIFLACKIMYRFLYLSTNKLCQVIGKKWRLQIKKLFVLYGHALACMSLHNQSSLCLGFSYIDTQHERL